MAGRRRKKATKRKRILGDRRSDCDSVCDWLREIAIRALRDVYREERGLAHPTQGRTCPKVIEFI